MGILSGGVALAGMLRSKYHGRWTFLFLATTVLTSVTGFFFREAFLKFPVLNALAPTQFLRWRAVSGWSPGL